MASIPALVRKVERAVERYGTTFPYKRGINTFSVRGLLSVLAYTVLYGWFLASESSGWKRPAFQLLVAGDYTTPDGGPQAGDLVSLPNVADGSSGAATVDYTVRKIYKLRLAGTVLYTRLYLAVDV